MGTYGTHRKEANMGRHCVCIRGGTWLAAAIAVSWMCCANTGYGQLPVDDLTIYYSFDEDTISDGIVEDLSGNENHGALKSDNFSPVDGQVGEALEFPGGQPNYISVQNHAYDDVDIEGLTLAVWVKTGQIGMIASWDRSEFFRFAIGDDQLGNNQFVAFDTCCGIHDWHGNTDITDDDWHHVAAVFDGDAGEKRIYVDGELDADTAAPHATMGKAITRFGFIGIGSEAGAFDGAVGPTFVFAGLMDEFVLYSRALTEAEYEKVFNARGLPVASQGRLSLTWAEMKITHLTPRR